MMRSTLLLVVLCIGSTLALDFAFKANANVSLNVNDQGWQYRKVQMSSWNFGLWKGANYLSLGVTKSQGQATVDLISGACYMGDGVHPTHYIAYFDAAADWSLNVDDGYTWATATNITAASGYVAGAYLRLVETTPDGTIVASWNLRGAILPSASAGVSWSVSDHSSVEANLKYVTLEGDVGVSATWSVSISFIGSNVAGVLNQSDTIVGPKNFESILQIQNWPYQSSSNNLNLLIGVGTGSASISASGQSLVSVNNTAQVYFTASKKVTVSGSNVDAVVDIAANVTANIPDPQFTNQLMAKYGESASYHIVTVKFPAGAANIIYDPSVGAGEPMEDASAQTTSDSGSSSSGSTSSFAIRAEISVFFLLVILLAFL